MSTPEALPPAVAIHLCLALAALLLGPVALAARKGSRVHRGTGYAWVTLMFGAALSSLFIRSFERPNIAGYTPIHLLVLLVFFGIGSALWQVAHGNVQRHRQLMWTVYIGGCLVAGAFTLLPSRYLGQLLWHHALGLI
ncbi:DUF2306 domain-containing protein [Caldimonas thermodepolymerans]|jgi:Predicted membrane protein|uniref:DUF2306 domain-containing protein n=1 Tax=Caldimonas thermodepolymerans TaxID=215580 RepID=UPI002490A5B6|nr:DUF2306 domain-containing protein [Caldimonas thermodepolymerans]